jgi:hypothetical protein
MLLENASKPPGPKQLDNLVSIGIDDRKQLLNLYVKIYDHFCDRKSKHQLIEPGFQGSKQASL